ncbi:MAG: hypothetical protein EBW05_06835, partial [Betaproteobacteria bacterium]|nr:hypothetical protein [Betaproteobacteria bacterium]
GGINGSPAQLLHGQPFGRLGRLALSLEGIAMRDRMVFDWCHRRGLPCVITMGGGYADPIDDTVSIHYQTLAIAFQMRLIT